MKKLVSVYILVRSLSKAEKRFFQLYAALQGGEKVYLALFDMIESAEALEEVQEAFGREQGGKSIEVAAKHLYAVILDCLVHLREQQDVQARIFQAVTKADILFERGMAQEAQKMLTQAKRLAKTYQKEALLLLIYRTELRYLSTGDFQGVSEKELVARQMKITEVMKMARNSNLHTQLYDILKHRFKHQGYVRSERQKEALNDLLLHELNLVANSSYTGFETEKLHLLFQATYFLQAGNYGSAIRYYQRLMTLFEENPHMVMSPPTHYLNALLGILDSLEAAGLQEQMPAFIARLREIEQGEYATGFVLKVQAYRYMYEAGIRLKAGRAEEIAALREAFNEGLFRRRHLLELEMQLRLHVHEAGFYLAAGQRAEARRELRTIRASGKLFAAFPHFRTARLINLLLQSEQGNDEFVDQEIRALRREMRSEKRQKPYATEKLLFKFVRAQPLPADKKRRDRTGEYYRNEIAKIREDHYERSLLVPFDFLEWIEKRLP